MANAESLTARLEAEKQRVERECPGYIVWWLYGSRAVTTWHAREKGAIWTLPVAADTPDDLIAKLGKS